VSPPVAVPPPAPPVSGASVFPFDKPTSRAPNIVFANVVRALYHFGRSVSDLARACRSMGEGAYDRLRAEGPPGLPLGAAVVYGAGCA